MTSQMMMQISETAVKLKHLLTMIWVHFSYFYLMWRKIKRNLEKWSAPYLHNIFTKIRFPRWKLLLWRKTRTKIQVFHFWLPKIRLIKQFHKLKENSVKFNNGLTIIVWNIPSNHCWWSWKRRAIIKKILIFDSFIDVVVGFIRNDRWMQRRKQW